MNRLAAFVLCAVTVAAIAAAPANPLDGFEHAWSSINSYQTQVACFNVKGSQTQLSSYDYTFTKPSSISMNIVSGPSAGNSVTWSGGDSVVAGRGMFKRSFKLTDPTVTSLRGATVVDLSFGSILQHAQQTKGTMTASTAPLNGIQTNAVNIDVADPASDGGLTRESLYLSPTTNLPLRVDGYEGSQLVSSCTFTNTKT